MNQAAEFVTYNMFGTRVADGKLLLGSQSTIDLQNLSTGMYIIRLTTGNKILSGKFIRK
jgi:hypothetical protein